jgi:hypothetical protein
MNSCKCSVCIRCKLSEARELLRLVAEDDDKTLGDDPWYAMEPDLRAKLDEFLEGK